MHIIGIDLGATWLRLCRVSSDGGAMLKFPTPPAAKAAGQLARELQRLMTGQPGRFRIGIARAPGVDARGIVKDWPSRPDWNNIPLLPVIAATAPTVDADDGLCAAMWEHHTVSYQPRAESTTACVTIGTGLGVGVVRDGAPLPTGDGAGTVAHLPLGDPDAVCSCGGTGCLQATLSSDALSQNLRRGRGRRTWSALTRLVAHLANRYSADRVVFSGGGLRGDVAAHLRAFAATSPRAIRVAMSATPSFSTLGGAVLLAAGDGADASRMRAQTSLLLQRWQTLDAVVGLRRATFMAAPLSHVAVTCPGRHLIQ